MRGALLIFKKEFLELSKDRRTLFFAFVFPLVLWPLLFGMMAKLGKNSSVTVDLADAAFRRAFTIEPDWGWRGLRTELGKDMST